MRNARSDSKSFQCSPRDSKHESVQNRLKAAVAKETPKIDRESQINIQIKKIDGMTRSQSQMNMEVDDVTSSFQAVGLSDRTHPISRQVDEAFIEKSLRVVRVNRKFKQQIELDAEFMDNEGFSNVKVLNMQKNDGSTLFHVMPYIVKSSFEVYKQALDETYEQNSVQSIPLDQLEKFKSHLVMAKNENHWSRAQILSISHNDGVVALEDIDSGKKIIQNLNAGDKIKIPRDDELIRPAYAIKIKFANVSGEEEPIEVGDIVKIKITDPKPFDSNWGEVKFETEQAISVEKEVETNWTRQSIENIQFKEFHTGLNVKLLYCDGSLLEQGKLHVCESVKENWAFYDKLAKEIKEYVKENPSATHYKPV